VARRHQSIVPLSHDHRDALALAFRLHHPSPPGPVTAVTPPSTPASRAAEVLDFFVGHLDGHFRAEEDALFPAIARHLATDDPRAALVHTLIGEHREMESMRDALAALAASAHADETILLQPLIAFADLLERHIRREERELFADFATIVPEAAASAVGARIRAILSQRPPLACAVAAPKLPED